MDLGLSAADQRELEQRMNQKQLTLGVQGLFKVIQRCFDNCIDDFTSKSLTSVEESCSSKCAQKINLSMSRLGIRLQEAQEVAMKTGRFDGV